MICQHEEPYTIYLQSSLQDMHALLDTILRKTLEMLLCPLNRTLHAALSCDDQTGPKAQGTQAERLDGPELMLRHAMCACQE